MRRKLLLVMEDANLSNRISSLMKDFADIHSTMDVQDALYHLTIFFYQLVIINKVQTLEYTYETIKAVRKIKNIFILYLSSTNHTDEKIAGLDAGADIVLSPNCPDMELRMQIYALIRRHMEWESSEKPLMIQKPPLHIDYTYRKVYWEKMEVKLTKHEFDFLFLLAATPECIYTYGQIYQIVWGDFAHGDVCNVLWCMVYRLKKKLKAYNARAAEMIHAIRNVGYYFKLEEDIG